MALYRDTCFPVSDVAYMEAFKNSKDLALNVSHDCWSLTACPGFATGKLNDFGNSLMLQAEYGR